MLELKRSWIVPHQPGLGKINDRLAERKDARINWRVYVTHYTRRA